MVWFWQTSSPEEPDIQFICIFYGHLFLSWGISEGAFESEAQIHKGYMATITWNQWPGTGGGVRSLNNTVKLNVCIYPYADRKSRGGLQNEINLIV